MDIRKKTKIVATIGPATESAEMMERLVEAGVDVIRLNFSHGDHVEHGRRIRTARALMDKLGRSIGILQDLCGPKIRIGDFETESIVLKEGELFTLTTQPCVGNVERVFINYPTLPKEVRVGGAVLLDDGRKRLEVVDIKKKEVVCRVVVGGEIRGRRGANFPGAYLKISSITDKDRADFAFAVKHKVDFVALSFVRRPEDVAELRDMMKRAKLDAGIIAKIETPEAVEHIDDIIALADGIMVARGDLAIEVPAEQVPMIQKMIIEKCNNVGKPVITATQMLDSMIESPTPTRAEVSDIANAILDGTDAVMLSEETTLGAYPVEAVEVMTRVALEVERGLSERCDVGSTHTRGMDVVNSVTAATVDTAHAVGAKLIFALTETGFTARMVSRYKPAQLIMALSPQARVCSKLNLSFGCCPVEIDRCTTLTDAFKTIRAFCLKHGFAEKGDTVVIAAGAPFNTKNVKTNMLLVEVI